VTPALPGVVGIMMITINSTWAAYEETKKGSSLKPRKIIDGIINVVTQYAMVRLPAMRNAFFPSETKNVMHL